MKFEEYKKQLVSKSKTYDFETGDTEFKRNILKCMEKTEDLLTLYVLGHTFISEVMKNQQSGSYYNYLQKFHDVRINNEVEF